MHACMHFYVVVYKKSAQFIDENPPFDPSKPIPRKQILAHRIENDRQRERKIGSKEKRIKPI